MCVVSKGVEGEGGGLKPIREKGLTSLHVFQNSRCSSSIIKKTFYDYRTLPQLASSNLSL